MVKLHNEEQRRKVWENKKKLTGRKERIVEDFKTEFPFSSMV